MNVYSFNIIRIRLYNYIIMYIQIVMFCMVLEIYCRNICKKKIYLFIKITIKKKLLLTICPLFSCRHSSKSKWATTRNSSNSVRSTKAGRQIADANMSAECARFQFGHRFTMERLFKQHSIAETVSIFLSHLITTIYWNNEITQEAAYIFTYRNVVCKINNSSYFSVSP